jgi:hypothetical protein
VRIYKFPTSNPTDESGARDLGLPYTDNLIKQSDEKGRAGKNCPFGQSLHPAIFKLALLLLCLCVCMQSFPAAARWADGDEGKERSREPPASQRVWERARERERRDRLLVYKREKTQCWSPITHFNCLLYLCCYEATPFAPLTPPVSSTPSFPPTLLIACLLWPPHSNLSQQPTFSTRTAQTLMQILNYSRI